MPLKSITYSCWILTLNWAVNQETKQVHPVEGIRISTWPVDVVEFAADAYAHRKQVGIKQLYNQVPQTAWVSCSSRQSVWGSQFQSQLEIGCPLSETEGLGSQWPWLSSPPRMRNKCCYGQKNLGSICGSLSPSPTHLSHTTNINPFE